MKNHYVYVPDELDNTGLGQHHVFPSKADANQALKVASVMFPSYAEEFDVVETEDQATTDFEEWNSRGW